MKTKVLTSYVPVFVDSVKIYEEFRMVRCNYLTIENDCPKTGWALGISGEEIPLLMLGLVGVIMQPFNKKRFNSIELVEEFFKRIEDDAGLFIDIDDIWLPLLLFSRIHIIPKSGHVYRINGDLFTLAFSFREGRLDVASFLGQCEMFERPLYLSRDETRILRKYHKLQIENAKEQYPKNSKLELKYHNDEDEGK